MPPRCRPGSMSTTFFPMRAACNAATTPPDVPPYTATSTVTSAAGAKAAANVRQTVVTNETSRMKNSRADRKEHLQ